MTTIRTTDNSRSEEIRRLVEQIMLRRARGESLPDERVTREHPHLAPELGEQLRVLGFIERARTRSRDGPVVVPDCAPASDPAALPEIDGYTTVRRVGTGGQGTIFEAYQRSTGRRVAIKLMHNIQLGVDPQESARFRREVRALGRLQHPGIVGILASGVHQRQAYCVTEFVDGVPLDQHLLATGDEARGRDHLLELFEQLCLSVHAAHLRGVIHRDLKPGNVLVDDEGRPHVLDFGLARLSRESWDDVSIARSLTGAGQFVGSLPWASPEQARGESSAIDLRTDVYSLGVMLYQALAGEFPYAVEGPQHRVVETISTVEPKRPSLAAPGAGIGPDLDAVVLKALAKAPAERYQSAADVAADLARCRAGEPVSARAPGPWAQARSYARRHRTTTAVILGVALALALGMAATTWQMLRAHRAELRATAEAHRARHQTDLTNIAAADLAIEQQDGAAALKYLDLVPDDARGWEWRLLRARADQTAGVRALGEGPVVAQLSRDGAVLTVLHGGVLRRINPRTGMEARSTQVGGWNMTATSDASLVVVMAADNRVLAVDGATGSTRWETTVELGGVDPGSEMVCDAAPSPDGTRVFVTLRMPSRLRVFDATSGERVAENAFDNTYVWMPTIGVSPDGRLVCTAEHDRLVVRESASGSPLRAVPLDRFGPESAFRPAFSPDGAVIAVAMGTRAILLDARTGELVRELRGHTSQVRAITFSHDGERIATASSDSSVRVWSLRTDAPPRILLGHRAAAVTVEFDAADHCLISGGEDGTLRAFDAGEHAIPREFSFAKEFQVLAPVRAGAFTPDASVLVVTSGEVVARWSLRGGSVVGERMGWLSSNAGRAAFDPSAERIAWSTWDVAPKLFAPGVWRVGDATPVWIGERSEQPTSSAAWSPDGTRVAMIAKAVSLSVYSADDGALRASTPVANGQHVAFSPDSSRIYVAEMASGVGVYDARTARRTALFPCREPLRVAVSPDGTMVGASLGDGSVALFRPRTGERFATIPASPKWNSALCFSPDSTRLAIGSEDCIVRVYDCATRELVLRLRGHTQAIGLLAFSRDGRYLASGARDYRVLLWDTKPDEGRVVPAPFAFLDKP